MSAHQFKVGDHVVCVDARAIDLYGPGIGIGDMDGLKEGDVYTIRRLGLFLDVPVMWLEEIHRPIRGCDPEEPGYALPRFRPVQKRKTSIEVFERLLTPSDHEKHLIEVFDFVSMQGDLQ